jgi:hypothetical protein
LLRRWFGSELPFLSWLIVLVGSFVVILAVFAALYWTMRLTIGAEKTEARQAGRLEMALVGIYAMAVAVLTVCPINTDLRGISSEQAIPLGVASIVEAATIALVAKAFGPIPRFRSALLGLLFMGLAFCFCRLVGVVSGAFALFCAVGVGIAFLMLAFKPGGLSAAVNFLGLLLVAGTGILAVVLFPHPLFGARFEQTPEISVAQAPQHQNSLFFRFRDGRLATELQGSFTFYNRKMGRIVTHAAPIVPDNWHEGDPIPAWAVTRPDHHDLDKWTVACRTGIRLETFLGLSSERDAIKDAQKRFNLTSEPGAPLLVWAADPKAEFDSMWQHIWIVLGIASGVWLIALFVAWIRAARRPTDQSGDEGC